MAGQTDSRRVGTQSPKKKQRGGTREVFFEIWPVVNLDVVPFFGGRGAECFCSWFQHTIHFMVLARPPLGLVLVFSWLVPLSFLAFLFWFPWSGETLDP